MYENPLTWCLSCDRDGCYVHIWQNTIFFPGTSEPISTKLGMKHRSLKPIILCTKDSPGLTLTYYTARSNFATQAFIWEQVATDSLVIIDLELIYIVN